MKPSLITALILSAPMLPASTLLSYTAGVSPTAGTSGAADPTSQGWSFFGGGNNFAHGLDSNLGGWRITDGATSAAAFYERTLTTGQVSDMNTLGWTATWTNTMNHDAINIAGGGVDNYYNTSRQTNNQFWLSFGSVSYLFTHSVDANGDFTLSDGSSTFQITSTGSNQMAQELGTGAPQLNQYVTYTLSYDALLGQATLTDSLGGNHGVVAAGGALPGGDRLVWGATSGAGQGSTTWNSLDLSLVPEPSLSALGLISLLACCRRRR
jgi:hypothetical protein